MKHPRAVFDHDQLRKGGLMLNTTKCKLICDEVKYLGHVVTKNGLKRLTTITLMLSGTFLLPLT